MGRQHELEIGFEAESSKVPGILCRLACLTVVVELLTRTGLRDDHVERSRSLVCGGCIGIRPGTSVLLGLSSEHDRQ